MSFQFYTLPQNISGAAVIPISSTPTPLAFLTAVTGPNETVAALRANIGWRATSGTARVLFKLWRGAPVTGELLSSVLDSAESFNDYAATTDFSQIVTGLTPGQPVTFVLTAENTVAGTASQVIGPLTLTAFGTDSTVLSFYEFPNNVSGGALIPVAQAPVPLAILTIHVNPGDNVTIRSTVGWTSTSPSVLPKVDVLFKLWRGAPGTGVLVISADDSADVERAAVTTFSHVDTGFTAAQDVTYVLTVEAPDANHLANVVGAMTLSSSLQTVGAFFTLPNNTSGSVVIPLTSTGTPLAVLTLQVGAGQLISLRGAVGWAARAPAGGFSATPVLFKLWRGAPNTGTLIYSTLDSAESAFDFRKVTALAHIDSGFTATGLVTYTLTGELVNTGTGANVIGPLTFTAVPE